MVNFVWTITIGILLITSFVVYILTLLGILYTPKVPIVENFDQSNPYSLSIIVPARNESRMLDRCLSSITRQNLPRCELKVYIAINNSFQEEKFRMEKIVKRYQERYPGIFILRKYGNRDRGWVSGKTWVLHQVLKDEYHQLGDYILFLDADVKFSSTYTLASAVSFYQTNQEDIALLSLHPKFKINSWVSRLVVTMMPSVLNTTSYINRILWRGLNPNLSAIAGWFLLFNQRHLAEINGNQNDGLSRLEKCGFSDDIALGMLFIRNHKRARIVFGGNLIENEMYENACHALSGMDRLGRNTYGMSKKIYKFLGSVLIFSEAFPFLLIFVECFLCFLQGVDIGVFLLWCSCLITIFAILVEYVCLWKCEMGTFKNLIAIPFRQIFYLWAFLHMIVKKNPNPNKEYHNLDRGRHDSSWSDAQDAPNAPFVEIIRQDGYNSLQISSKIESIIEERELSSFFTDKSILMKVSFVFPARDPSRSEFIITNPKLIVGVAHAFARLGAREIIIADGETFGPARYAFEVVEIRRYIEGLPREIRKKIRLCFLDEVQKTWVEVPNFSRKGVTTFLLDIPNLLNEVDIFVSMPKLKVNIFAKITLSVKNGMGFVKKQTRLRYHNENLHGLIAAIYYVRPPDYVITDAIVAGEGQGPMNADRREMNVILFGNNGLAVDAVSCELMGFNPLEIPHLVHLQDFGLGSLDTAPFIPAIAQFRQGNHPDPFRPPKRDLHKVLPRNISVYRGRVCESGCDAFVQAIFDSYGRENRRLYPLWYRIMQHLLAPNYDKYGWDSLGPAIIVYGKNPKYPPIIQEFSRRKKRHVMVVGNCAKSHKKIGHFYGGWFYRKCAPDYMRILMTLPFRNRFGLSPFASYVELPTLIKTFIQHLLARLHLRLRLFLQPFRCK